MVDYNGNCVVSQAKKGLNLFYQAADSGGFHNKVLLTKVERNSKSLGEPAVDNTGNILTLEKVVFKNVLQNNRTYLKV